MKEVVVHRVKAFTIKNDGGNEAGVVLLDEWLSESSMQSIAKTIGYSETVFAVKKDGNIHLRYFTPIEEVDLCGHASLALMHVALEESFINPGSHTLFAKTTTIDAHIDHENIALYFSKAKTLTVFKHPDFLDRIDLNETMLNDVAIAIMDMGVKELYIGFKDKDTLESFKPDLSKIKNLSKIFDVAGIYMYHADLKRQTVYARNFLPAIGIDEESATGTATAALSTHIHNTVNNKVGTLVFYQGQWMGKPSRLTAAIDTRSHVLKGVYVSGTAVITDSLTFSLSDM